MTASLVRMLARGAARRCARCGAGGLFSRWFQLTADCPGCGLHFEREEGYWTGAMMINLAVTEVLFLSLFIGLAVAWWPDPPWGRMFVILIAVNATVPIVFYPFSKSLWVAADMAFRTATDEPD